MEDLQDPGARVERGHGTATTLSTSAINIQYPISNIHPLVPLERLNRLNRLCHNHVPM
jgi:hypothetical protein